MYRASHWLRIDYVVGRSEYAGRCGQADYRAVVGKAPREFDRVKFLVTVLNLAGAVGDENRGKNQRVVTVGLVQLDTEYIV